MSLDTQCEAAWSSGQELYGDVIFILWEGGEGNKRRAKEKKKLRERRRETESDLQGGRGVKSVVGERVVIVGGPTKLKIFFRLRLQNYFQLSRTTNMCKGRG